MIDHVTLNVRDVEALKAFYAVALRPLGYQLTLDFLEGAGSVARTSPTSSSPSAASRAHPSTWPFAAPTARRWTSSTRLRSRPAGQDNGPPGIRRVYHEYYYGAYVLDPEGNNIEAVTHEPE